LFYFAPKTFPESMTVIVGLLAWVISYIALLSSILRYVASKIKKISFPKVFSPIPTFLANNRNKFSTV